MPAFSFDSLQVYVLVVSVAMHVYINMQFRLWLETAAWYHGTRSGDAIREQGFTPSTSGGGQRGLMGVWLTKDYDYANVYANVTSGVKGQSEVLAASIPDNIAIADLTRVESYSPADHQRAQWQFVGLDIDNDNDAAQIRSLQPYALTKLLQKQGYGGALIPNTIQEGGPPELVIFDPGQVTLTG